MVAEASGVDAKALQEAALKLLVAVGDPVAVLRGSCDAQGKVSFVAALSTTALDLRGNVGKVVGMAAKVGNAFTF
mgnify:CR=1 FL=1